MVSQSKQNPETLNAVKAAFLNCFSTSTGHGLPQIAKPDNLFLRVLWALFFIVALVGNSVFIYQAVDQYLQLGVITTTKINREEKLTLPALTFCIYNSSNTKDMILECNYGPEHKACKINNLTLYDRYGDQVNCVQLNYGTNLTELVKAEGEGYEYGYYIRFYIPPGYNYLDFAVTDNKARVVEEEVRKYVSPGQSTQIVLSETNQTALGPPYSPCNETQNYRQVNF